MKKLLILALVTLLCTNSFSQKKKSTSKKAFASSVLAKADNLTAEIVKNNFYLFVNNGKKKDTITIKSIDKIIPTDCKITSFSAKATPLYLLTWTEKSNTNTPTKTEDITQNYSEIYEITSKTKAFANIQTSSKIKEQVFLDKLKNASETQERMHNEGFTFTLTKEGDVVLSTKKQENKMTFDVATKKYIDAKKKK